MTAAVEQIEQIVRERARNGKRMLGPTLVSRALHSSIEAALSAIDVYCKARPGVLILRHRALCDHCGEPTEVSERISDIIADRRVEIVCGSCSKRFEATSANVVIDFWINTSRVALDKEMPGESTDSPGL